MADSSSYRAREIDSAEEPLLNGPKKGGIRALPFIIANQALESLASYGLTLNMTRYLMGDYGMSTAQASNVLFLWASANGATTVLEAFLADSYFGRFRMIAFGTVFSLLGMILLWLTAAIPQARPSCHKFTGSCDSPTGFHLLLLFSSFGLMSIGSGGIRGSSLAFGGNQLNSDDGHKNEGVLERFIGWFYVGTMVGTMLGTTVIVYIQDKYGWNMGFGIPAVLMFLSMVSFLVASPFYVKMKPTSNLLSSLLQVILASYRNTDMKLSPDGLNELYHHSSDSEATLLKPTQKLRFLNKACIIRNPNEKDAPDRWSPCTVDQVEDLKAVIRVIPIWAAGILLFVSLSQNTILYVQISSMDRHVTADFEIPAGSFPMFLIISIGLWVLTYDQLLVPLATKIRGKPTRMTPKQKIGFAIVVSSLALAVSGIVEVKRRAMAMEQGFSDDPVKMSVFWLLPYGALGGIADASCMVGLNEFFYSELPKSMSSIAIALPGLGMAAGNLAASFIMTTVDSWTRGDGGESWVSSNINKGHYEYYYWLISGLCLVNFLYFLACGWSYGPGMGEEDESL